MSFFVRARVIVIALLVLMSVTIKGNSSEGTCSIGDSVCTLDYSVALRPWMHDLYQRTVMCRRSAESHPFITAVSQGDISRKTLLLYFKGMFWHVARSGHLFVSIAAQRPPAVNAYIESIGGRVTDGHSSDEAKKATSASLGALIEALGGNFEEFLRTLDTFVPPNEWFLHNAQLRSAIYSPDLSWEVSIAAMNAGTEGVVPWYCGPLADALKKGYGIDGIAIEWLRIRGTEEAKRHGDNGFKILSTFIPDDDIKAMSLCSLYVDRLAWSMSHTLLDCGMRLEKEENQKKGKLSWEVV